MLVEVTLLWGKNYRNIASSIQNFFQLANNWRLLSGFTAMVKHEEHFMSWQERGVSDSPWHNHGCFLICLAWLSRNMVWSWHGGYVYTKPPCRPRWRWKSDLHQQRKDIKWKRAEASFIEFFFRSFFGFLCSRTFELLKFWNFGYIQLSDWSSKKILKFLEKAKVFCFKMRHALKMKQVYDLKE